MPARSGRDSRERGLAARGDGASRGCSGCHHFLFFLSFLWNWLAPASGLLFFAWPLTMPLVAASRCLRSFFSSLLGLALVVRLQRQFRAQLPRCSTRR